MTYTIAAFYRFVSLADPAALREEFCEAFDEAELCGTMLIGRRGRKWDACRVG